MSKKSRPGKRQFIIGTGPEADFSPDYIEALTYRIAEWFRSPASGRNVKDPVADAKAKVRECLLAETAQKKPWTGGCPDDFAGRIRVKCSYDIETGEGIPQARVKHPDAVRRIDDRAIDGAKAIKSMDPVAAAFDAERFRAETEASVLEQFPELDNAASLPLLRRLTLLFAQQQLIDYSLMMGVGDGRQSDMLKSLETINKMTSDLQKQLGIHPDQIRLKLKSTTGGTAADLVALISDDDDFRDRERIWALQRALQLYWMANHPNGAGDGPQVEEWEVYHMTRSRPIRHRCQCGREAILVEGFTPAELRDYLVRRGVLVEKPAVPGLIREDDLVGLATAELPDYEHDAD